MEDTRKIKEIYDCAAIVSDEELYPLQKWYNQLIDKTIHEITVPDVLRMIRQKQWIDLAMSKAINLLKDDVFAGESYDGELLEKVSELDGSFLVSYADNIRNIIKNALEKCALHEWAYDGEEDELKQSLHLIEKKIIRFQVKRDKCLK